jgi:tetratricopeptide (TPR) repeat protein
VKLGALDRLGRGEEAQLLADRIDPVAVRFGHSGSLMFVTRHRFERILMNRGDFTSCLDEARLMLLHTRPVGQPDDRSQTMAMLAHFFAGRLKKSTEQAAEAASVQARFHAGSHLDGDAEGHLFLCHTWAGNRDAGEETLRSMSRGLPSRGQPVLAGRCWRLLCTVEGLATLGDRERAATLHELVLGCLATGLVVRYHGYGLARTVAGISAGCANRWHEAEEHFATALHQADELPHVIEQAEVRRWWAWTLLHRGGDGDRDRARELLGKAIEIYDRLGMPIHLERARVMA